jgi:predicted regulator of Ras-like GTPase activity (Roadblock/LC7/MglB family)
MLSENIFSDIKKMNGYLGIGISQYTGELLLIDESDSKINLEETAMTFNDVFRSSHELSHRLDLGKTEVMEITTEKSKILMACSGENRDLHIHIFAIFKKDGNVALAKLMLPRVLKKVIAELS